MIEKQLHWLANRSLLEVAGNDAFRFLQNLVTNDLNGSQPNLVYSALLTPQGKYLFDFFVIKKSNFQFFIDISSQTKDEFLTRLMLYKLRSDVSIEEVNGWVGVGFFDRPSGALNDPRCEKLGWRKYFFENLPYQTNMPTLNKEIYDSVRVDYCIPETGVELIKDQTFILEAGLDRLAGVSFTKGCFIGQEVTARMRHKTQLQKGLARVRILGKIGGSANDILFNDKVVGTLFTRSDDYAIAYLKFKYRDSFLTVGNAQVILVERY